MCRMCLLSDLGAMEPWMTTSHQQKALSTLAVQCEDITELIEDPVTVLYFGSALGRNTKEMLLTTCFLCTMALQSSL